MVGAGCSGEVVGFVVSQSQQPCIDVGIVGVVGVVAAAAAAAVAADGGGAEVVVVAAAAAVVLSDVAVGDAGEDAVDAADAVAVEAQSHCRRQQQLLQLYRGQ